MIVISLLIASMGKDPGEAIPHNFSTRTQQGQYRIISLDPDLPQIDREKIQAEPQGQEDCARQNLMNTADK